MFTPTPPREELPVPSPPPRETPYPDISLPRPPTYSPRAKILWQALLGGSLISAAISFIMAGLGVMVARYQDTEALFRWRFSEPFLSAFLSTWIAMLPLFSVLVGVAAAVEMLIKKGHKQTQQATQELVKALHLIAANGQGPKPAAASPTKDHAKSDDPFVPTLELAPEPRQSAR